MPVSPALAEGLSQAVVELYREAERILLARLALNLGAGIGAPDWVEKKLLEVQFLTHQTQQLVADLGNRAASEVAVALAEAYNRGGASAAADLAALLKVSLYEAATPILGLPPVELLVAETMGYLNATGPRILRSTMDVFRSVIGETASQAMLGTMTRRQASQQALNRFAAKGITGFVDKAGRSWSLESYSEMAVRTACAKAAVQGHTDRLQANGLDLVIISDAPRECPLCRPHEQKVYSISGSDPNYPSLESARAAGLWHPGCRHSAALWQEGITAPKAAKADPEGYAAGQKQRLLERKIREAKRIEAAAMDNTAKRQAQVRIRAAQAKLRGHLEDNPSLKRLRYREQVSGARPGTPDAGRVADIGVKVLDPAASGKMVPRFATQSEAHEWLGKNVGMRSLSDNRLTVHQLQDLADGCYAGVKGWEATTGAMEVYTSGAGRCAASFGKPLGGGYGRLKLNAAARKRIEDPAALAKSHAAWQQSHAVQLDAAKERVAQLSAQGPEYAGRLEAARERVAKLAETTRYTTYMDAERPMVNIYAHEMGHRVMTRAESILWDRAMTKAGVTSLDKYRVSEYAGFGGGGETFAEVHALIALGQQAEVPRSLLDAYEYWARVKRAGGPTS